MLPSRIARLYSFNTLLTRDANRRFSVYKYLHVSEKYATTAVKFISQRAVNDVLIDDVTRDVARRFSRRDIVQMVSGSNCPAFQRTSSVRCTKMCLHNLLCTVG